MEMKARRASSTSHFFLSSLVLVLFLVLALGGCSGGGGGSADGDNPPATPTGPVTRLDGDSASNALDATFDLFADPGVDASTIEADAVGARVARTEIEVWFKETATVGEINDLLATHAATVVGMLEGVPFLLVHIPDPGSLQALDAVVAQLEASPVVEEVVKGIIPVTEALPGNHTDVSGNADWTNIMAIDHHLAIGAHGAWNVRTALDRPGASPPYLLIVDAFGNGAPLADYDILADVTEYGTMAPETHGYEVLSVISAEYGDTDSDRGRVTGMYPGTLTVDAVDIVKTWNSTEFELSWSGMELDLLAGVIRRGGSPVVVNASLGSPCDTQAMADLYCGEAYARAAGVRWIRKVRGRGLEGQFVLTSGAGNISDGVTGHQDARYDSAFNAAALISDLMLPDGTLLAPVANTLVVENLIDAQVDSRFEPVCLHAKSKWPGTISAIGSNVSVLSGPSAGVAPSVWGTSFSAPQVAGLVTYAWALQPRLTNFQVIDLLRNTAHDIAVNSGADPACGTVQPAPVIDAFTALLGLDVPTHLAGGASTPVRMALLDVDDNGRFDELDLAEILDALDNGPDDPNFSRYDLNGDGFTGGKTTTRFDLDMDAAFGTLQYSFGGASIELEETELMDHDVLCYYAKSPLYTGPGDDRDEQLDGRCKFGNIQVILGGANDPLYAAHAESYVWGSAYAVDEAPGASFGILSVGPVCEVTGGEVVDPGDARQYLADVNQTDITEVSTSLSADFKVTTAPSGSMVTVEFKASNLGENEHTLYGTAGWFGNAWNSYAQAGGAFIYLLVDNNTSIPIDLEATWQLDAAVSGIAVLHPTMDSTCFAEALASVGMSGNTATGAADYCSAPWNFCAGEPSPCQNSLRVRLPAGSPSAAGSAADVAAVTIEPGRHLVQVSVVARASAGYTYCTGNAQVDASGWATFKLVRH